MTPKTSRICKKRPPRQQRLRNEEGVGSGMRAAGVWCRAGRATQSASPGHAAVRLAYHAADALLQRSQANIQEPVGRRLQELEAQPLKCEEQAPKHCACRALQAPHGREDCGKVHGFLGPACARCMVISLAPSGCTRLEEGKEPAEF